MSLKVLDILKRLQSLQKTHLKYHNSKAVEKKLIKMKHKVCGSIKPRIMFLFPAKVSLHNSQFHALSLMSLFLEFATGSTTLN